MNAAVCEVPFVFDSWYKAYASNWTYPKNALLYVESHLHTCLLGIVWFGMYYFGCWIEEEIHFCLFDLDKSKWNVLRRAMRV